MSLTLTPGEARLARTALGIGLKAGATGEFLGERMIKYARKKKFLRRKWLPRRQLRRRLNARKRQRVATHGYVEKRIERNLNRGVLTYYTNYTAMSVGTIAYHQLGAGITKGDDVGQRTGSQITLRGIRWYMHMKNENATINKNGWWRILILHNKRPTELFTEKMFAARPVSGTSENAPRDFLTTGYRGNIWDPINRTKYRVLLDRRIRILHEGAESAGKNNRDITIKRRFRRTLTYNTEVTDSDKIFPQIIALAFFEYDDGSKPAGSMRHSFELRQFYTG